MATAFQTAYKQNLEKMTIARDYAKQQRESQSAQTDPAKTARPAQASDKKAK
ncbi:MAG: hypothetical protein Q8L20_15400 [Gammaproteobacteria bacterium]|nr:hypothetical protein [Gammaproteobacteria bacterium]